MDDNGWRWRDWLTKTFLTPLNKATKRAGPESIVRMSPKYKIVNQEKGQLDAIKALRLTSYGLVDSDRQTKQPERPD